jgi:hypothetical protein
VASESARKRHRASGTGRKLIASFKSCVPQRNPPRTWKRGESNGQNRGAIDLQLTLVGACITQCTPRRIHADASPQTVHVGHFSAALKPVLTINSGDIVVIETVSGPDPEEVDASGVVPISRRR